MSDCVVRATAAEGYIRAFSVSANDTVEEARRRHKLSPIATDALGRLLMAGLMMGADLKGADDLLTIKINCEGPIGGLIVTANNKGEVKGYVHNPAVDLPLTPERHLDIRGALDLGVLSVIKDIGLKEPYIGDTILTESDIADDLTYYFAVSEQIPSAVGLGVSLNKDGSVSSAGGFILQVMPGASDTAISIIEDRVSHFGSITDRLLKGESAADLTRELLKGLSPTVNASFPASFRCNCSKERMGRALLSIGKKELADIINEGKPIEMNCQFCGDSYEFSIEEILNLK